MRFTLLVTVSAWTAMSSAFAQEAAPARTPPAILVSQARPGTSLSEVLKTSQRVFRELDADRDGALSQADAELHETVARANSRSRSASQIMRYDLDNDGSVTEEEVRSRQSYEIRLRDQANGRAALRSGIEAEVQHVLAADANKDGRVTWQEALNAWTLVPNAVSQTAQGLPTNVRDILAFADKADSTLSSADFDEFVSQIFRTTDADQNGTISQEEFARMQQRSQEQARTRQIAQARAECVMPRASNAAKVVLLSAYQARGLSTATIGSQEVEVRTGQIKIEDGVEPLYLVVLSSDPVIWRFNGAVDRLERVILGSNRHHLGAGAGKQPLAGATGVAANKVQFLPRSDCLRYFSNAPSTVSAATVALVRNETGKEPIVAARHDVSSFSAPSGAVIPQPGATASEKPALIIQKQSGTLRIDGGANVVIQTGPTDLVSAIRDYYPDGVVQIDPPAVVASGKVESYEVLPGLAGLLQHVNSGALEQRGAEFHIKQKIRFPAGLSGAHSARFLLLRGTPLPDGPVGRSCVISEETGQPVPGTLNPC